MPKRKQHSAKLEAKVALEAIKGIEPTGVLAARFSVHPSMISRWKNQLLDGAENTFPGKAARSAEQAEAREAELHEQIGRLKMELEWLEKKVDRLG